MNGWMFGSGATTSQLSLKVQVLALEMPKAPFMAQLLCPLSVLGLINPVQMWSQQCHFPSCIYLILILIIVFYFWCRWRMMEAQQNFLFHTPPAENYPLSPVWQHFTQPWQEDNVCAFTHREPRQTLSLHFLVCRMSIGAIYSERIAGRWKMGPFVPFCMEKRDINRVAFPPATRPQLCFLLNQNDLWRRRIRRHCLNFLKTSLIPLNSAAAVELHFPSCLLTPGQLYSELWAWKPPPGEHRSAPSSRSYLWL